MTSAFILVPAYNEAPALGATLASLPGALPGIDAVQIVVVDDGSRDGTSDVVLACGDPRVVLLRHAINRGLGAALGTALAYARANGADYAVTFDADGQHAPEDIEKVLAPLVSGAAEVVIGSRLLDPTGMPWYRVVGNWGLNVVTYALFGVWTTDSQSGFRGFGQRAMREMRIRMDRMEVSSEFLKEFRRCRLRYQEVPVRAIYTEYSLAKGQSNWNAFNILLRLTWHRLVGD